MWFGVHQLAALKAIKVDPNLTFRVDLDEAPVKQKRNPDSHSPPYKKPMSETSAGMEPNSGLTAADEAFLTTVPPQHRSQVKTGIQYCRKRQYYATVLARTEKKFKQVRSDKATWEKKLGRLNEEE